MALRSALERIVTAYGPGFGDWQWRLAMLPFAFGGLCTKLLRHMGIVAYGSTFDDSLCMFNNAMEIDFLSIPRISAGKEVDIGLSGDGDKALRLADMLLYSWEGGLDVCVDLMGSSPLTQTGMVDFVPGRAVIDVAQRKRDAVTLQKRIRKFSMAQDIGARAAVHIFNRISFSIAKGVGAR
nr:hypothetical protein [Tanacetum cinerariifolium]